MQQTTLKPSLAYYKSETDSVMVWASGPEWFEFCDPAENVPSSVCDLKLIKQVVHGPLVWLN